MQLVPGADRMLSAWWVGGNYFTLPWLPGRTVSTEVASAAVQAAMILRGAPNLAESCWSEVRNGAELLGLTPQQLARQLAVDCDIPVPPRTRGYWVPLG